MKPLPSDCATFCRMECGYWKTSFKAMRLALFQPDIAANAGALLRLAACLGLGVDLIEPAGFVLSDRRLRRAGMDYLDRLALVRHASFAAYLAARPSGRLVLLTTGGAVDYPDFAFRADDTLLLGRESAGVPPEVHVLVDARLRVPMVAGARSLTVALAAAMVVGEALRQTGGLPGTGEVAGDGASRGDRA